MPLLYLFKASGFNITNLPQWCLYLLRPDLYGACKPALAQGGRLYIDQPGSLVSHFTPDIEKFRYIDWHTRIQELDDLLSVYYPITFATYYDEQFRFLKQKYQSDVLTISYSYNQEDIDLMHTWLAKYHVRMQEIGQLPMSDHDIAIKSKNIDLISYYKNAFKDKILKSFVSPIGDYDIPIRDFFSPSEFLTHLENISDTKINKATLNFYNLWLLENQI